MWDSEDAGRLFYDKAETVRFRVESEEWNDHSPLPPSDRGAGAIVERKSPYSISAQGSMAQSGLGLLSWW